MTATNGNGNGNGKGSKPASRRIMIYVLRATESSRVKIGSTIESAILKRQADIQTGCPERLERIAFFPGSRKEEHALKARWRHLSRGGEWFQPDREMEAWIESVSEERPQQLTFEELAKDLPSVFRDWMCALPREKRRDLERFETCMRLHAMHSLLIRELDGLQGSELIERIQWWITHLEETMAARYDWPEGPVVKVA